ncbi:MAG: hypothetical protein AAFY03_04460 [Pseudomonadota bacterium]
MNFQTPFSRFLIRNGTDLPRSKAITNAVARKSAMHAPLSPTEAGLLRAFAKTDAAVQYRGVLEGWIGASPASDQHEVTDLVDEWSQGRTQLHHA